jgi:hypothetical protein
VNAASIGSAGSERAVLVAPDPAPRDQYSAIMASSSASEDAEEALALRAAATAPQSQESAVSELAGF